MNLLKQCIVELNKFAEVLTSHGDPDRATEVAELVIKLHASSPQHEYKTLAIKPRRMQELTDLLKVMDRAGWTPVLSYINQPWYRLTPELVVSFIRNINHKPE
jgi:hypothetical protein